MSGLSENYEVVQQKYYKIVNSVKLLRSFVNRVASFTPRCGCLRRALRGSLTRGYQHLTATQLERYHRTFYPIQKNFWCVCPDHLFLKTLMLAVYQCFVGMMFLGKVCYWKKSIQKQVNYGDSYNFLLQFRFNSFCIETVSPVTDLFETCLVKFR